MKILIGVVLAACYPSTEAFAPLTPQTQAYRRSSTARAFGVDSSFFQDLPQQVGAAHGFLQDALTSFTLADGADALGQAADAASQVAPAAADAVDNGWFGFLTVPIEGLLDLIHTLLVAVGLQSNTWGLAIVALTILIKVVTYPLTKSQLESTNKMQAMQPAIKELQAKYQSNPEVMNQKIAEFYQVNNINPLAGCLPSFAQIPIFIGLYRAVLNLAAENKLDEPFLFLPNLEGPTYGADPAHGSDWILTGWQNGTPSMGWETTIAFLILPLFLVVSQYVSMELMQPKTTDPAQQQSNAILKVLPLMIGWFSLNVPAALAVYWVINNIITTGLTLFIRNTMPVEALVTPGSPTGSMQDSQRETIFAPPPPKPAGFGTPLVESPSDANKVRPITPIDATIEKKEVAASTKAAEPAAAVASSEEKVSGGESSEDAEKRAKRKRKKGKK